MKDIPDQIEDLLDPIQFQVFYRNTLPVIYGYFLRRCRQPEDAAELAQETYLSALRSLRSGQPVGSPLPWLVTVARRRLVDHYRRQEVRRRRHPSAFPEAPAPPAPTSEAEVRLLTALDSLPATYRLALILRYVDDLPLEVVADHLGRSPTATESLLARSRRALAEAYGDVAGE